MPLGRELVLRARIPGRGRVDAARAPATNPDFAICMRLSLAQCTQQSRTLAVSRKGAAFSWESAARADVGGGADSQPHLAPQIGDEAYDLARTARRGLAWPLSTAARASHGGVVRDSRKQRDRHGNVAYGNPTSRFGVSHRLSGKQV